MAEREEEEEEEQSQICRILEEQLGSAGIMRQVFHDLSRNLYIMLDDREEFEDDADGDQKRLASGTSVWRPAVYAMLAYQGFMIIAYGEKMLLPEMQKTQCIIDWEKLHVSKKAKRLANTRRYNITVNRAFEQVISGIQVAHGPNCWLGQRYAAVISALQREATPVPAKASTPSSSHVTVLFHSVELWSEEDELLCGEVGYSVGQVYTSMTGFVSPKVREPNSKHTGAGILQLVSLGKLLQRHGYAFWNLGHPFNVAKNSVRCLRFSSSKLLVTLGSGQMLYKRDIGGVVLPRADYLRRWNASRDQPTPHPHGLGALSVEKIECSTLISPKSEATSGST